MATGAFPASLSILIFFILIFIPQLSHSQLTQPKSGCTFLDDQNVFNIEVLKGRHQQTCPTIQDVNDQFKATENKLSETAYDVMQLQTEVLRLMDTNVNLTLELTQLQEELRATQYAILDKHSVSANCPPGYPVRNDEVRSCYMFVGRSLVWYDAEIFCMSTRGHLVALETEEEQNFLVNYVKSSNVLPGSHFWTGGNDIGQEGEWMWAGINQPFNHSQWMVYPHPEKGNVNQPDNSGNQEHCLLLFHLFNYDWNDAYCYNEHYFICEYKLI